MGENGPANPKINDVWVTNAGELRYYDGAGWVPYVSPPETGPGPVFQPGLLEESPADDDGADDGSADDNSADDNSAAEGSAAEGSPDERSADDAAAPGDS